MECGVRNQRGAYKRLCDCYAGIRSKDFLDERNDLRLSEIRPDRALELAGVRNHVSAQATLDLSNHESLFLQPKQDSRRSGDGVVLICLRGVLGFAWDFNPKRRVACMLVNELEGSGLADQGMLKRGCELRFQEGVHPRLGTRLLVNIEKKHEIFWFCIGDSLKEGEKVAFRVCCP